ncbi:unnamed protein product, partial [Oppiella nova]
MDNPLPVNIPGFGACDRLATTGVMNCYQNFLYPVRLYRRSGSGGGVCCNYSKYKACYTGLYDGLRIAMERERCPKSYSTRIIMSIGNSVGAPVRLMCDRYSKYRACISGLHAGFTIAMERERCPKSYTSRVIKSYGESVIGLPLNQICGTAADGKSRCPPSRGSKPKKKGNQKPKRAGSQEPVDPSGALQPISGILNRGTGGLGGGDPFGGVGSVFQRGTDTIGQGASGILGRGAGGLGAANPLGAVNPLGAANPFGGVGSLFQTGVDTIGQGASSLFGGGAGGSGSRRSG